MEKEKYRHFSSRERIGLLREEEKDESFCATFESHPFLPGCWAMTRWKALKC